MPQNNYKIERLDIVFSESKWDWIIFTVKIGEKSYPAYFTSVWDPICSFKFWLEEIASGNDKCEFEWDGEGPDFRFEFELLEKHLGKFTAGGRYGEEIAFEAIVDRRQLLNVLYRGFLSYADSYKFIFANYERLEVWQFLTRATRTDFPELIDILAGLDRKQIAELFADARPRFRFSIEYSNSYSRWSNWGMEVDTNMNNTPRTRGWDKAGMPLRWCVPANFDSWGSTARRDFAEYSLPRVIGDQFERGNTLRDLRSKIIEDFLSETAWDPATERLDDKAFDELIEE